MTAKRKKRSESQQNEGAQMSNCVHNELESDSAMVMILESFGVDGAGYDETESPRPSRQVRQTRSEDHVSGH